MPVPSGTMAQIFKDVASDATGSAPAPEVSSYSDTSTSTPSTETSAPTTEAQSVAAGDPSSAGAPPAVVEKNPQRVSWSRYESLRQEHHQTLSNMETMQQKLADLESRLAQQVVQADPKGSAPKANESQSDWLQRLLDEGDDINPKLVEQIRGLENKLEQMNQSMQTHNQRWQSVEWAQANAAYDENFSKLQSFCPKWDEERLTTMIAEGVKPRMIVAMYRDVYGDLPSQPASAPQSAQVQRAAPPRIDGPSTGAPNRDNEPVTKGNYLEWVRQQFNSTRH